MSNTHTKIIAHDNTRSKKVFINTVRALGIKGGSILIGLLLIPMTINYVNPIQYGVWLTISSIVSWMSFFDIGMGNGLRNHVAEKLASNEFIEVKKYISTTYAVLSIIAFVLFITFSLIVPLLNWNKLLNIPENIQINITLIILVVFYSFCFQFVIQLINTILLAVHESAISALIVLFGQIGVFIAIFILTKSAGYGLIYFIFVLTGVPVIISLISSLYLFTTSLRQIAPSIKYIDFSYAKKVLGIGGAFFIVQIGALVLFQTDNLIITHMIGLQAVTQFNVCYKLFSVITLVFSILLTPYWSAFTDAYAKNDFEWMKVNTSKIRSYWGITTFLIIPLFLFSSKYVYELWLGRSISIPFTLSLSMALYVIGHTGMILNCYILNGIGKIRIQLLLYILSSIINIPLAIILSKYFGTEGVILSNVGVFIIMCIVLWIQTNKILNQTAFGLWVK